MDKNTKVIDVEVVGSERGSSSSSSSYTSSSSSSSYSSSSSGQGGNYFSMTRITRMPGGDLPQLGLVPFVLFFFCLFRWGFLASLGFAFFCCVGTALSFWGMLKSTVEGRPSNPWLWRIGTWAGSLLLVSWLV